MPKPDGFDTSSRPEVEIVLVTAPRCHFCSDASNLLNELSDRYSLTVQRIELESAEGIEIATRYAVPFPPVLLINGAFFGHGRISRRKLTRALDAAAHAETLR